MGLQIIRERCKSLSRFEDNGSVATLYSNFVPRKPASCVDTRRPGPGPDQGGVRVSSGRARGERRGLPGGPSKEAYCISVDRNEFVVFYFVTVP